MSITSPDKQQINAEFASLLACYPGLGLWLAEIVQSQDEPRAMALLPSFLRECADLGVPGDVYPFICADQGLADLQTYLHKALAEVETLVERTMVRLPAVPIGSTSVNNGQQAPVTAQSNLESPSSSSVQAAISADEDETAPMLALKRQTAAGGDKVSDEHSPQATEKGKRSGRTRTRRRWTKRQRIVVWALIISLLGAILVPAGFLVNFGISAYNAYHNLSNEAHTAVSHLLNVKTILIGKQFHLSSVFDVTRLQQAQKEFKASGDSFHTLQNELKNSSTLNTVVAYFPSYRTTFQSAQEASVVGSDIAQIGQLATASCIPLAPALSGPLLATTSSPLVTQAMLGVIGKTLTQVLPLLKDIQIHSQQLSLSSLPISAQERVQVESVLQQLPQLISYLDTGSSLLNVAGWVLGVDQPRTFLVQTMDESELRGSGGFTGQYGELKINGGRVEPFSLKDISQIEYVAGSANQGQYAPEQYRSWWPFANWGLRDSNISADFPTTAQLAISLYKQEVGNQVDGVISFTPVLIEHILSIIGPITVPDYKVTVTAQNIEDVLHYYQLNNTGITQQENTQPNDTTTSTRKRFTNDLATLFVQKVRSASPSELLSIARQVFSDLKTKDLQVYFANPAAEAVLEHYGDAGQLDRSTEHDGLFIVQQNLSASKASQYVKTNITDTVTLDSEGGATHLLQLRLVYNQAGPVYGYDAYYDYVRVYVPPNSRLISGDGFATGTPLCGGGYGNCPVNGVYPGGELTCPTGQYQPGAQAPSLSGSDGASWEPLQTIGGPTNTTSDEAGRAMYGGWVIVPKNCTMNVTLSWYVPPLSQKPYSLLVQRQIGTFPQLDLTILPGATDCTQLHTSGLHFTGVLTRDTSFTIPTSKAGSGTKSCYPQPEV